MKVPHNITVLLLLKDRSNFTQRWLEVHNDLGFSLPIHIADGSLTYQNSNIIHKFLNSKPVLNIDYKFYGKDINLEKFYQKIYEAVRCISTDYVILADNDDFLIEESIMKGAENFRNNEDLIAVSGPAYDTTICNTKPEHDQTWGVLSNPINQYPASDRVENNALSRLQSFLVNRKSSYVWSAIHKRKIFLETCKDILKINPIDFRFLTHSIILFTLARGKVSGSSPCMTIHQDNPGESAGKKLAQIGTWHDWIQTDNWFSSYKKMILKLTDIILENENHKREELKRNIEFMYQGLIGELILRITHPYYLHNIYKKGETINKSDPIFNTFIKIKTYISNKEFKKKERFQRNKTRRMLSKLLRAFKN